MTATWAGAAVRRNDELILSALRAGWWEARIAPKLYVSDECWLWTRALDSSGYGKVMTPSYSGAIKTVRAHRVALISNLGRPLHSGMVTNHLCRVRRCCNPDHLDEVTNAANVVDDPLAKSPSAAHKRRTSCLTCGSTLIQGKNQRYCKTCVDGYHVEQRRTIHEARGLLGLSFREYVKNYGQSIYVAQAVIGGQ